MHINKFFIIDVTILLWLDEAKFGLYNEEIDGALLANSSAIPLTIVDHSDSLRFKGGQ